ncbi:9480_t:CDS:2 [Entrophospora sp. SA101]|nr:9480_t:CDS:2 [Entrophospora sp. SA101]
MFGNTIGANANFSYNIKNGPPEELSKLELNSKRTKFEFEKLFGKIEAKITKKDLAILKEVLDDQETLTLLRDSPYITAENISKRQEQLIQKKDKLRNIITQEKPPINIGGQVTVKNGLTIIGVTVELSGPELDDKRKEFEELFDNIKTKITQDDLTILNEVLKSQEDLTLLHNSLIRKKDKLHDIINNEELQKLCRLKEEITELKMELEEQQEQMDI